MWRRLYQRWTEYSDSNRTQFTMSNNTDLKPEAEDGSLAPNVFLKSRNATVGIEWDSGRDTAPAHKYTPPNTGKLISSAITVTICFSHGKFVYNISMSLWK